MTEIQRDAVTLREKAYASFTQHLLARDIQPGQFVSQRELVQITGMPLGAIREMIPRLEADGLVRTVPQRGLQVAHVDLELIHNAFQLRQIIEREAVVQFCRNVGDDELAAIHEAHVAVRDEADGGISSDMLERAQHMDWDFHDRMVDALGNTLISNIYRVNSVKMRLIRLHQTRILPELLQSVMDEHLAIIGALLTRDELRAACAIEAHIASARRRALGV